MRHRLAVIGIVMLSIIVLLAVFADLVSSKPFFTDVHRRRASRPARCTSSARTGPGATSGPACVYGARTSLVVGLGAVAIYVAIGTVLGGLAGLRRRPHRLQLIMRADGHADEHPDAAARDRVRGGGRAEPGSRRRGHRPARLARRVPPRPRPVARPARGGVHHGRAGRRREHDRGSCSATCCRTS